MRALRGCRREGGLGFWCARIERGGERGVGAGVGLGGRFGYGAWL